MQPRSTSACALLHQPSALAVLLSGWAVLLAAGWFAMAAYAYKREATSSIEPPIRWPANSQIPRIDGRDCLLIFLHPKCPCSQATLAELEKLFRPSSRFRRDTPVQIYVIATTPSAAGPDWADTRLIERSSKLAGARVIFDRGGAEASRFAAEVSSTVMLFDARGARRYAGGVTRSRGHEGDNVGLATLQRLLSGAPSTATAIPALGCRLVLEETRCAGLPTPHTPRTEGLPLQRASSLDDVQHLKCTLANHDEAPAAAITNDFPSE